MSESTKTDTNKGCIYVFQQGDKKGEQCGISCRGDLCFKHNPKTKQKQKEYYVAKKQVLEEEPEEVNIGCKYVFIQGPNKGKPCGSNCRGDYCHQHKASVNKKKHEYYETHIAGDKMLTLEEKLDEMIDEEQFEQLHKLMVKEKNKLVTLKCNAKYIIMDAKNNKILLDSPNPAQKEKAKANLRQLSIDKDKVIAKLHKQKKIYDLYEGKYKISCKKMEEQKKKELNINKLKK